MNTLRYLHLIAQNTTLCLLVMYRVVTGSSQIPADPDMIGCSMEFIPTMSVKTGDFISMRYVTIGGFIASRNEPRFNQGLLPNHNWRGFITGTFFYPILYRMQTIVALGAGIEHESSHATMGISEATEQPFELIYDNTYRKSVLNSFQPGVRFETYDANNYLLCTGTTDFYVLSKNTPELTGLETGRTIGFSLGGVYRYLPGNRWGWFASFHERHIFTGPSKSNGKVYQVENHTLLQKKETYPIVNSINTLTCCTGFSFPFFLSRHRCEIFLRYLYGHIYGYIDSREIRSVFSVGVAFITL